MIEESMQSKENSPSEKGDGGCYLEVGLGIDDIKPNEWLEETVWYGMRMWHVIFLSIGTVLSFVILLCCCFKFRIPRTKQEIEGDYIRRRIMRKFRKRLKAIQNQELDEMDLKKALDKIRTELKSDTESLQQSDVLSGTTLSSAGIGHPAAGSTYRRASQIQIDISLEDLRIQSLGLGARIALAFNRFFGRSKKTVPSNEENGTGSVAAEMGDKPTTALLPKQKDETASSSDKKAKDSKTTGQSSSVDDTKDSKSQRKSKGKDDTKEDITKGQAGTARVTMEKETKKKDTKSSKEKEKGNNETSKDSSSNKPSAKERETSKSSSADKTKVESQKSSAGTSTKPLSKRK